MALKRDINFYIRLDRVATQIDRIRAARARELNPDFVPPVDRSDVIRDGFLFSRERDANVRDPSHGD